MGVARKTGEDYKFIFELRWLSGDSDDEDETADLMRELEKIKKERAEQREREVCIEFIFSTAIDAKATGRNKSGRQRSRRNGRKILR